MFNRIKESNRKARESNQVLVHAEDRMTMELINEMEKQRTYVMNNPPIENKPDTTEATKRSYTAAEVVSGTLDNHRAAMDAYASTIMRNMDQIAIHEEAVVGLKTENVTLQSLINAMQTLVDALDPNAKDAMPKASTITAGKAEATE